MKKQTDKNTEYMETAHGTTCLVSEAGRADRLLEVHRSRVERAKRLIDSIEI